jgi:hypothetical protein
VLGKIYTVLNRAEPFCFREFYSLSSHPYPYPLRPFILLYIHILVSLTSLPHLTSSTYQPDLLHPSLLSNSNSISNP